MSSPAPGSAGPLAQKTLLDLIKQIDPARLDFSSRLGKTPDPTGFKMHAIRPRSPGWDSVQAQSRLLRSQHLQPMHYVIPNTPGALDLKALDAMRKKIDDTISAQMLAMMKPHMAVPQYIRDERRDYPNTTAGLEEAMRLDCEHDVAFGLVIHTQEQADPGVIERWIWGPNGEFTGFPAGDDAFEDTWAKVSRYEAPQVCPLVDFEHRFAVSFRFTPRYTRGQLRQQPWLQQDMLYGRANPRSIPRMVQFHTYADQAQWAALARRQAQDLMMNGERGQRGGF